MVSKEEITDKVEETPMEQLIKKIGLYDDYDGINMHNLKRILESYHILEGKWIKEKKHEKISRK